MKLTTSTQWLSAGDIHRKWFIADAEGQTLGRLSTQVAATLRGKHKPNFVPNLDCGDYVIVINAEKIQVTGKKREDKVYAHHTGYPGGLREITFDKLQAEKPEEIIRHSVRGMLPKGKLGRTMLKKLRIYVGPEHDHEAQKPEVLTVNKKKETK